MDDGVVKILATSTCTLHEIVMDYAVTKWYQTASPHYHLRHPTVDANHLPQLECSPFGETHCNLLRWSHEDTATDAILPS